MLWIEHKDLFCWHCRYRTTYVNKNIYHIFLLISVQPKNEYIHIIIKIYTIYYTELISCDFSLNSKEYQCSEL